CALHDFPELRAGIQVARDAREIAKFADVDLEDLGTITPQFEPCGDEPISESVHIRATISHRIRKASTYPAAARPQKLTCGKIRQTSSNVVFPIAAARSSAFAHLSSVPNCRAPAARVHRGSFARRLAIERRGTRTDR